MQPRALTLPEQFLLLKSSAVAPGEGLLRHDRLRWRFAAHPHPLSRSYEARLDYRRGAKPQVFIEAPDLVLLAGGRRLPHVYSQEPVRLCLYLPRAFEWRRYMRLDQTIIPWTALWLFYFEEWLWSDDWKGGGVHPEPAEPKVKKRKH